MPTGQSFGAFFFLGPPEKSIASVVGVHADSVLRITGSGITGLPGYKVFLPPDTYNIIGVSVSSLNTDPQNQDYRKRHIEWQTVAGSKKLKFAYIRLASNSKKDAEFDHNWNETRSVGLKRGAYYVYDFSVPAEEQFMRIKEYLPLESDALPFAIDPEMYVAGKLNINREAAITEIIKLKHLCGEYFGKPPIIYGGSPFFQDFRQTIDEGESIWLARWASAGGTPHTNTPPTLFGREPWTIWQFSGDVKREGIPGTTDLNAFFGTAEDFDAFARGVRGVAKRRILQGN